MLGLGIESTAHTFSCAVVERKGKRGEILSDVRKIYGPPDGQGIHPREASRHHVENSSITLAEALNEATLPFVKDIANKAISKKTTKKTIPKLRLELILTSSI